ncbi:unnamed protein product [Heterobilharzia americana]|nr:unnamed protein product [Heterobilharzia americana]
MPASYILPYVFFMQGNNHNVYKQNRGFEFDVFSQHNCPESCRARTLYRFHYNAISPTQTHTNNNSCKYV